MSLPPPLKMPLVQAMGVTKKYARKGAPVLEVLSQIDMCIEPGDKIAILGKSGSGKSTLLHILGTLDRPTTGDLLFSGQKILTLGEQGIARFRNEKLGFVFQFHYLMVEFSALENVMMPMLIAGRSRKEAAGRAESLLIKVGLKDRLHHRPAQLSGGEQSRVAIARALANRPALLLTDEMTGNLDAETARHIFDLIQALHEEFRTALVSVTHDQAMANEYQKVFTLERGKLLSH